MNLKIVSETLSATTMGTSFGLWTYECNSQGQGNGTQNVIVIRTNKPAGTESIHQAVRPEILSIVPWIVAALTAFAIFKMLAAGMHGVLTSIFEKGKITQY
jgi:hypothetical protein